MSTVPDIEEIKESIRMSGLRATPARVATLRLLGSSSAPLSHAEVAEQLSSNGIDKATAFRNLNDMAEVGLLRRAELGDHLYRFEIEETGDEHHPHFLCTECGSVTCLNQVRLTAASKRVSEQAGQVNEILLRGICNKCQ